jgi:hypothetical protein
MASKLFTLFLVVAILTIQAHSQIFVPFGFWQDKAVRIASIANTAGPRYTTVTQSLTINGQSQSFACSSTYLTATSTSATVLATGNITFSGTFPNCFVSMTSTVSSGTSTVGISFTNNFNQSATVSFTFTAYAKPVMAFSFRRVVKDYIGSPIRVRRISDNAESDIGFDGSGNLDLNAFNTFKGASSLQLKTWYDQSGNGYDATQATNSLQPGITIGGFNGAPQVDFSSVYWLQTTQAGNIISSNRDVTIFYATKAINESRTIFGVRDTGNNRIGSHINWSDGNLYWDSPGVCCSNSRVSFNNTANANLAKTYTMGRNNGYQYIKVNGTNAVTRNDASGTLTTPTRIFYLGATNDIGTVNEIVSSPLSEYVQYLSGLTDAQVDVLANEQKNYFGL